jgi:myosin-3
MRCPDVFSAAENSYQVMINTSCHQCFIISGESGSGKTEVSKLLVNRLISLSSGQLTLEQRILQCNPLLEGFGNAKTQMNYNSSRFGKYLQLKFNEKGKVIGAKINEYLLEKSRVVYQNPGERNFHIFYWMLGGLDTAQRETLHLNEDMIFKYLGSSEQWENESVQFQNLKKCFNLIGFNDEEQHNVLVCLAGILHFGNIVLDEDKYEFAFVHNSHSLEYASKLLGINKHDLCQMLTTITSSAATNITVSKHLSKIKAEAIRDSISKALYDRVFRWIVNRINQLLASSVNVTSSTYEIGILDIFGFENFQFNSFEQLCINLANEQLHNFFMQHVFHLEFLEYKHEGIQGIDNIITNNDSQHLLNCFLAGTQCVFHMLDDEISIPRATDEKFLHKLNHLLKNQPFYTPCKSIGSGMFTIKHFAEKISYSVKGFLEKNSDSLPAGVKYILESSENELVNVLFKASINTTGTLSFSKKTTRKSLSKGKSNRTTKHLTISSQFKSSLKVLIEQVDKAMPHFIRCIKPNQLKSPEMFDAEFVQKQLLYTGMLETVKLRRDGFSYRPTFKEFYERYRGIWRYSQSKTMKDICLSILEDTGIDSEEYQIGLSKIFLKHFHVTILDNCMEEKHKAAILLQAIVRGHLQRLRYVKLIKLKRKNCKRVRNMLRKLSEDLEILNNRVEKLNLQHDLGELKCINDRIAVVVLTKLAPPCDIRELPPPLLLSLSDNDDVFRDDSHINNNNHIQDTSILRSAELVKPQHQHHQSKMLRSSISIPHSWVYGMITQQKAETLLKEHANGTYLVRTSRKRLGYILSYRSGLGTHHMTITHLPNDKYVLEGETSVHDDIEQLIQHYTAYPIMATGEYLTFPCSEEIDFD